MIKSRNLRIISIFGTIAVIAGAFGSHYLKTKLSPEYLITWHTAVEYQFYHTLALGICLLFPSDKRIFRNPSTWFILGILLFSGSLYMLALTSLILSQPLKMLGILTPLGGLSFILGWVLLGFQSIKNGA